MPCLMLYDFFLEMCVLFRFVILSFFVPLCKKKCDGAHVGSILTKYSAEFLLFSGNDITFFDRRLRSTFFLYAPFLFWLAK